MNDEVTADCSVSRRFLHSLPDGGRKISDFAERVRLAISERDEEEEEEEQKRRLLLSAGTELQSKYQQAFSQGRHGVTGGAGVSSHSRPAGGAAVRGMDVSHPGQSDHSRVSAGAEQRPAAGLDPGRERALIRALENVSLSEPSEPSGGRGPPGAPRSPAESGGAFPRTQPHTTPNYLEVLERTERTAGARRPRYKPNQ